MKELAYILATKDQYQQFGFRDTRYWRLSRQDAERMLQTLEKGLNGEFIFEFKENVDKEEKEEQQRLSELWEQGCQRLGFDIEKTHDGGDATWVARPHQKVLPFPPMPGDRISIATKHFVSKLRIYIKVLEAYEFAAGSPDKALMLQKCAEEMKVCIPHHNQWHACQETHLQSSYEKMQELLQAQSLSTLQSLSTFLLHDVDALVSSSPSRYIVWFSGDLRTASHLMNEGQKFPNNVSERFGKISWCTWIKSVVDEILAIRLAEQHHHELKGLVQAVGPELKKLPLRDAASKTEAADVLSDASWVQVRSDIASVPESSDSSTSGISVETFGCPCFMTESVFEAPDGSFVSSQQLVKGSKVLGFDGSILTVNNPPEQHQARATVILHAAGTKLQVTPDHRIVRATSPPAFWREVM